MILWEDNNSKFTNTLEINEMYRKDSGLLLSELKAGANIGSKITVLIPIMFLSIKPDHGY